MVTICWGSLAKAADDTTTIEERIETLIAEHNQDPVAHGGYGYALYWHRHEYPVDHPYGSVYNPHVVTPARASQAIVGTGADADFDNIDDAAEYISEIGGGKILVRPGKYTLSSTVHLHSNTELVGTGANEVTVVTDDSKYISISGSAGSYKNNVRIAGIKFDCEANDTFDESIYASYVENITVENCDFYGADTSGVTYSTGITFFSVNDWTIRNCFFKYIYRALAASSTTRGEFLFNKVEYCSDNAIRLFGTKYTVIDNNFINCYVEGDPILVTNSSYTIGITNNRLVAGNDYIVEVVNSNSIQIFGNSLIQTTNYSAIKLDADSYDSHMIGNMINNINTRGIDCAGYRNTIIGNSISSCTGAGVQLWSGSDNNVVVANTTASVSSPVVNNGTNNEVAHNT